MKSDKEKRKRAGRCFMNTCILKYFLKYFLLILLENCLENFPPHSAIRRQTDGSLFHAQPTGRLAS